MFGIRGSARAPRKRIAVRKVSKMSVLVTHSLLLVLGEETLFALDLDYFVGDKKVSVRSNVSPEWFKCHGVTHFIVVEAKLTVNPAKLQPYALVLHGHRRRLFTIDLAPLRSQDKKPPASGWPIVVDHSDLSELWAVHDLPERVCSRHYDNLRLSRVTEGYGTPKVTTTLPYLPVFSASEQELKQRCNSAKLLGVSRSSFDELLLCFKSFGIHVNIGNGRPARHGQAINWECGRADRVAFLSPYFVLFAPTMAEVRLLETGQHVETFTAHSIRLISE